MKRKLLTPFLKQSLLAVPAAALMLGAAQAGTTIGLNFQSWYYDSGVTPQTIGFGQGYQTTGFPVTAKAFGVATGNWVNTDPLDCSSAVATSVTMGAVTANLNTVNMWESDIGNLVNPADEWTQGGPLPVSWSSVLPGNDEVTWSFEDNTGWTNTLTGLNAGFPNGYVIGLIGVSKCTTNSRVVFTDGVTTWTNGFSTIYTAGNANFSGPVGLMATPTLTSDTLTFGAVSRDISSAQSCALAGFVITDQPVVSKDPTNTSVNQGAALNLNATVIGVGPLAYQWRTNGAPILDATNATYTVPSTTTADASTYDVVVTNLYGSATSSVATVTVIAVPTIVVNLSGTASTIYAGANFSQWSVTASGGLPLHYNWFKDGTPVDTDSPTLTLTNVTAANNGGYYVVVTNLYGTTPHSVTNTLTVVTSPNLYTTDVAHDSPSAYWPLGETSGTTAVDYSGAGHNGNLSNSVTLGVTGPRPPSYAGFDAGKTAYQFDGATAYINCGNGPSLSGTTDFTVEAWVNTTATTMARLISQRSGFDGEYMFDINADGSLQFTIYGGGYQFNFGTARKVNDGLWHHIAAVRNGTNGAIYIDGTLAANATGPVRPLDASFTTFIGFDGRDAASYFNGALSDVAIYPVALSTHTITLHAYHGQFANAPFSVSVVPGGYVADTKPVGTLHHGVNNSASWTNSITDAAGTPVTRSGVAVFTGGSQITSPASTDFDSASGTICFWVQANAPLPGPGTEAAMLFDRRTTNGAVIALSDAGYIKVQCAAGANTFEPTSYIPDNNWHHVAVTYDQSVSGAIEVFIDGVSVGSQVNTTNWAWPTTQQLELGKSHDGYWRRLNGQMDDFRIYNRILTQPEIASIQTSDALVDTSALMLRYNFGTAGEGQSLTWPVGTLESSPSLSPASWTPVPNAVPPYPFLPPAPLNPAGTTLFYRSGF